MNAVLYQFQTYIPPFSLASGIVILGEWSEVYFHAPV